MHYREASAAERDRVLALRALCFGEAGIDVEKHDPRFWDWLQTRSRTFVGEENGALLTHLLMLTWPLSLDGERVPGSLGVEAMTSPAARGRGAFRGLARFMTDQTEGVVGTAYQIRDAVLSAMLRSGWVTAERVPVLMRPSALWGRISNAFRTVTREDISWMSEIGDGTLARTPEFLAWRFFDNPFWHYEIFGAEGEGYLVARRTKLKGIDTYSIVDLAWRDVRVAKALLHDAVIRAKDRRCALTAALVSRGHPAFGLFLRRGFLPSPYRFRLLVHPPARAARRWRVMWADTDHL
jgi:hypothetical protein